MVGGRLDGAGRPAVCRPRDWDEAAAIVVQARAEERPVILRGRGSKECWLPPGFGDAYDLVTSELSGSGELRPGNLTARFPAGTPLSAVLRELRAAGLWLPLDDLDSGGEGSLGGLLAAGMVNPLRLGYGVPRDWVLGLTVVDSEGRILALGGELVKNVAGYDLVHLHLGAWGRLGLMVEVSLRLLPLPEADASLCAVYASVEEAEAGLLAALGGRAQPAALEAHVRPGRVLLLARVLGDRAGLSSRLDSLAGDLRSAGPQEIFYGDEALAARHEYEALWRGRAADSSWRCRISLPAPGLTRALALVRGALGADGVDFDLLGQAGSGVYRLFWKDEAGPVPLLDRLSAYLTLPAQGARRQPGGAPDGLLTVEGSAARYLSADPAAAAGWTSFPPRRARSQDALEGRVLQLLAPGVRFNPHLATGGPGR